MPRWHAAGDQSCQPHGSRGWGCSEAGSGWVGLVWKWHQLDTFFFAINEGFVDLSSKADDIGPVTGDTDALSAFLQRIIVWGTVWLYSKEIRE